MTTLKTFTVAPEQDSIRTAFTLSQQATSARLSLIQAAPGFPEYLLKQDGLPVAILRGKELVCGGEHFAVIPILSHVPYWDGEQRLSSLNLLLYNLSQGWTIPAALDDAVDAEDDEFFSGIPEVAYTGQPTEQPEDYPLPVPVEWEPEPEPTPPAGMTPEEYLASQQVPQIPPASIYPWTFWYRGGDGGTHRVILEATYEDAQRAWDKLITTLDMISKRP